MTFSTNAFLEKNEEESGKSVNVRCKSFLCDQRLSQKLGARQKHDFGSNLTPPPTHIHTRTYIHTQVPDQSFQYQASIHRWFEQQRFSIFDLKT